MSIDNNEEHVYEFKTKTGLPIYDSYMRRDDAPYMVSIFEHMGADSRYTRFMQTLEHVDEELVWQGAERFAQLIPDKSKGLLAFADLPDEPYTCIGGARYVLTEENRAETAVSVRDDMHGMGIGSKLLQLITEEARLAGVKTLTATIQNENVAIWRVLRHLPHPIKRVSDGVVSDVEVDLTVWKA